MEMESQLACGTRRWSQPAGCGGEAIAPSCLGARPGDQFLLGKVTSDVGRSGEAEIIWLLPVIARFTRDPGTDQKRFEARPADDHHSSATIAEEAERLPARRRGPTGQDPVIIVAPRGEGRGGRLEGRGGAFRGPVRGGREGPHGTTPVAHSLAHLNTLVWHRPRWGMISHDGPSFYDRYHCDEEPIVNRATDI